MKIIIRLLLVILLFTLRPAWSLDFEVFSDLHWRLIGPFRGGRVLAVTGVPGQPNHFYFGSVGGGVWESKDAGRTWIPIFDDMPVASIGAIAVAPSDPNVIYVGTGEADMRSDIGNGNGMYLSTDAGKTWKHIGLSDTHQIGRVLVHPGNAKTVYVAALGHAYAANEERGVFRSTDGGESWQKILYRDADTGAIDMAFGGTPETLYASLWSTRRPPWNVYPPSYMKGSGLFKSTDGGNTWSELTHHGLPAGGLGRIGIAVAPTNSRRVYALVDAAAGGLYRSDDAGESWAFVTGDERLWKRGWYFGGVTVDPKNADVVYVCDVTLYKSSNAGKTFEPLRGAPGGDDYHQLWIDPENPERMITGVDQGTVVTLNGGKTWSSWYNQPTGQFYHAITDRSFPYWVYGAQQDSGAAGVSSRTSVRDGITIMHFKEITAGYENGYIAPDPQDPAVIYGGNSVDKYDSRTGQTHNVNPTFAYPGIYRQTWTLPLIFSPRNPNHLYFANQQLFRTSDGGKHWDVLSPDLTREKLTVPPNVDPVTAQDTSISSDRRAVIYSIAPSPVADDLIWIGTDDGLIWKTTDAGEHWQNVTPPALTPWSKVGIIEASHFDPNVAYAAIDRHRLDDYTAHIYRTTDGGATWAEIVHGIPDRHFVNVVREDSIRRGLLFAGTELGMFVSFDDGNRWQSMQLNLPAASVRDIVVHDADIVVATHGRAFWILDDITPLRQVQEDTTRSAAFLFEPSVAYRYRPAGFTGTPFPNDEPKAENPPFGAVIDYYLQNDAVGDAFLEIRDSSDAPVARFVPTTVTPPDLATIVVTPDWFPKPLVFSTKAGHHRLTWNLHYPLPEVFYEPSTNGDVATGRWAMPGEYSVQLHANGRVYKSKLIVKMDPRSNVPLPDLQQQFDTSAKIEQERVRLAHAINEVKKLLEKSEALRGRASASKLKQIQSLQTAVAEITDMIPSQPSWGAPGSTPTDAAGFPYLERSLESLQHAVENSDGAPSPDVLTGFEKQRTVVESVLTKWQNFKQRDLPAFQRSLGLTIETQGSQSQ